MKFTKMHGLGNDFIVLDNLNNSLQKLDLADFTKKYCDRHAGIGADGVLIVSPSETADANMRLINADGSEAEMCGNGIRCIAKYLIDNALAKSPVKIETLAGLKIIEEHDGNYKVDMGIAKITSSVTIPLEDSQKKFDATLVDMGNPHCVIFVDDFGFDWHLIGKKIEVLNMFPQRTNVEFVKVKSKNELDVRVWERGAGATLACGTGACASLAAAVSNKKAHNKVTINLRGGSLEIEFVNNRIYMTGPAAMVFEGSLHD